MKDIFIKVRVNNPRMSDEIKVGLFDSLDEAIEMAGKDRLLEIINEWIIRQHRLDWNTRMTSILFRNSQE